jgi:hypothetical protein
MVIFWMHLTMGESSELEKILKQDVPKCPVEIEKGFFEEMNK